MTATKTRLASSNAKFCVMIDSEKQETSLFAGNTDDKSYLKHLENKIIYLKLLNK